MSGTPIDHICLPLPSHSLLEREINLLTTALAPFGIKELFRPVPCVVGLGPSMENPWLWVAAPEGVEGGKDGGEKGVGESRLHVAFTAKDRSQVNSFHAAALKSGATDNGPPGVRKEYHPGYYAAFVRDFGGHNLEVVYHDFSGEGGKEEGKKEESGE